MIKNWLPYPRHRKIMQKDNYVIIVPNSYDELRMPLFCNICEIKFSSKEDEKAYDKFKCCSACADTWAYSNKEKWDNGWRPSIKQVELIRKKSAIINIDIVFE